MASPDVQPNKIIRQKVTNEANGRSRVRSYFENGRLQKDSMWLNPMG
jgi:hypothetical protein